jgi:hypothetical protein
MAANLTRNLVVVSWRRIYLMRSVKELYVHTSSRVSTYVSRFMIAEATECKYLRERTDKRQMYGEKAHHDVIVALTVNSNNVAHGLKLLSLLPRPIWAWTLYLISTYSYLQSRLC